MPLRPLHPEGAGAFMPLTTTLNRKGLQPRAFRQRQSSCEAPSYNPPRSGRFTHFMPSNPKRLTSSSQPSRVQQPNKLRHHPSSLSNNCRNKEKAGAPSLSQLHRDQGGYFVPIAFTVLYSPSKSSLDWTFRIYRALTFLANEANPPQSVPDDAPNGQHNP